MEVKSSSIRLCRFGWVENPFAMGLTRFGWAGCSIIRYLRPYFIRVGWITNSCMMLRYPLRGGNPPMMGLPLPGAEYQIFA